MKVKELFEETEKVSNLVISCNYNEKDTNIHSTKSLIVKYLEYELNFKYFDVTTWDNSMMVNVYNLPKSILSRKASIEDISDKIINFVSDSTSLNLDKKEVKLYIYKLQNYIIDFPEITISIYDRMTLANIHKLIKTEQLMINNCSRITGNVLGLLKFNCPISFRENWNSEESKLPAWAKILKKHLKDRDILACQEELMDSGFNEYAKL